MTLAARTTLPAALILALLTTAGAADDKAPAWKGFLPSAAYRALMQQATARLDAQLKLLEGGKLDDDDRERAVGRARGLAVLMAAYAQSGNGEVDAKRLATLRDYLLQLDAAVREGKLKEARDLYRKIGTPAVRDKVDPTPRALHEAKEREDIVKLLMNHFKTRAAGGVGVEPAPKEKTHDGLEAALYLFAARPNDAPELKPEELARLGHQTAVLAQLTRSLVPEKKEGEKDPAKWRQWSEEMREAALEFAQAAKDKKPDDVRNAARKINARCTSCHRMFRDG
jgi:hypothetical protein